MGEITSKPFPRLCLHVGAEMADGRSRLCVLGHGHEGAHAWGMVEFADGLSGIVPSTGHTQHLAWISDSEIVTRNSDGGTTAWDEHDAVMLHHQLGMLLTELADKRQALAVSLGAPVTSRSMRTWSGELDKMLNLLASFFSLDYFVLQRLILKDFVVTVPG